MKKNVENEMGTAWNLGFRCGILTLGVDLRLRSKVERGV